MGEKTISKLAEKPDPAHYDYDTSDYKIIKSHVCRDPDTGKLISEEQLAKRSKSEDYAE